LKDAVDARYVPSGHVVFMRLGTLFAVPFDAEGLKVRGHAVAVLDTVAQALAGTARNDASGAGQFAVAATGLLAWVPSPVVPHPDRVLVTVDRRGEVARLPAPTRSYAGALRVSRDGRLVMVMYSLTERGLWVYDLSRGGLTRLPLDGEAAGLALSPDGRTAAFAWLKDGRRSLAVQSTDGTVPPRALVAGEFYPLSFTGDGRQLAAARGFQDMVLVTLGDGQARVQPLIETPHREDCGQFSPDGRWLAYASNETGRTEVYVQPYPGPGERKPVSIEGGWNPAWNPNGRELFFLSLTEGGKRRMMAVDFVGLSAGEGPRIGRPRMLFEFQNAEFNYACEPNRCYDVAPDGQRFYVVQTPTPQSPPAMTHINLIQNWLEELKAKVPAQR
jgi:Tol biopolymer transport system component